jgi:predicted phosphodiesterase
MLYALLADVHANLEALSVVLEAVDRRACDRLICAGDLVGYGPDPNECLRRLIEREALMVLGNHDLMVLDRLPLERCVPDGRRAVRWTRRNITPDLRRYLDDLPLIRQAGEGIAVCHGSLDDPDAYVNSPAAARIQLDLLGERLPGCSRLVLGHTHRAALDTRTSGSDAGADPVTRRREGPHLRAPGTISVSLADGEAWVINPGSVGQSRDDAALARFAIYDSARRTIDFVALEYDVEACARKLYAAGLTTQLARPRQPAVARLLRVARSAAKRALRPTRR